MARRAHAFHRGICSRRLPTALGAGRASASPSLHPIPSPPLPPYAQPAPPFPVPSLHHPPAGAGVPRDPVDRPSAPAGGVSAGDPSGLGFLLGKDAIQLSLSVLWQAGVPFCGNWKDRSFCAGGYRSFHCCPELSSSFQMFFLRWFGADSFAASIGVVSRWPPVATLVLLSFFFDL